MKPGDMMRSMIPPVAGALVLIALGAHYEGKWTDRWRPYATERLEGFRTAMERVPAQIGDPSAGIWEGSDTRQESDERASAATGAVGRLSRTYLNPRYPSTWVSVYLICGASRKIAVHTPDACYPGSGFTMEGTLQKFTVRYSKRGDSTEPADVDEQTAQFATAVFVKKERASTQRLRVFWTWNATGAWEAPDYPRIRYGGRQPLCKLYLIGPAPPGQSPDDSPSVDFAQRFLPQIDERFFPSDEKP